MGFWSKARALFSRASDPRQASPATGPCDHHDSALEEGTPEFELEIARAELKSGNLPHGAYHLANLISFEPSNREWLNLLDEYLGRVNDDDAKLFPTSPKRYFAQEAIRAYAWARQGRHDDAISLLLQVAQAKPDANYLEAWVADWLSQPAALASLSQQNIEHVFAMALNRFPEVGQLRSKQRAHLQRFADLAGKVPADKQNTAVMQMTRAGLLRKLGRFPEALQVALSRRPFSPQLAHLWR